MLTSEDCHKMLFVLIICCLYYSYPLYRHQVNVPQSSRESLSPSLSMFLLEVMKLLDLREEHMIQACPWKASYSPGLYMFVSGHVTRMS